MSRIANSPVELPQGVEAMFDKNTLKIKGSKGDLSLDINELVAITQEENVLKFAATQSTKKSGALAGTLRSIVSSMVEGVTTGFVKELQLVGVGYRAALKDRTLNLTLGFSHPVAYSVPEGVELEVPAPTQIFIRGIDKQQVGQVAAEIRAFRSPEPYKGKGVRYANEHVKRKDAKKK
jgi:large subunit ribosomal protein L6